MCRHEVFLFSVNERQAITHKKVEKYTGKKVFHLVIAFNQL